MTINVNWQATGAPMGRLISTPDSEFSLLPRQVLTLRGDQQGVKIHCLQGPIWVTQAGDCDDYFLKAGETFSVWRPGTVVIQGMKPARLQILPRAA
jgi:hypothetical protein